MPPASNKPPYRSAALGCVCALALWGCSSRGAIDALEADLREKEQAQEELAGRLSRAEEDLKVARNDAVALRHQLNRNHQVSLSEEQADILYRAEAIKFNNLLTSGQNRDGQPGDEGLSVMLIPVDVHGDVVKLAGEVDLELFDMSLEADEQRLGQWKFTTEEVREHWHRGFIGTGYLFQVDWQRVPVAPELTLHARFSILDGRKFDATTQIKVNVATARAPRIADRIPADQRAARGPRAKKPTADRPPEIVPASSRVNARRPLVPGDVGPRAEIDSGLAPDADSRDRIIPGSGDNSTLTSDRWTEESIPKRR